MKFIERNCLLMIGLDASCIPCIMFCLWRLPLYMTDIDEGEVEDVGGLTEWKGRMCSIGIWP